MKPDRGRSLYRVYVDPLIALPLTDALRYIQTIDFSMVVQKLTRPDENIAKLWTVPAARDAIQYYKNYLSILRRHGSDYEHLPPSTEIDEIWHHHILDTYKYHVDCEKIFGHILHHYPYYGMRGESDFASLTSSFEVTQRLHLEMFGEEILSFELAAT